MPHIDGDTDARRYPADAQRAWLTARGFLDICRALVKAMIRGELEVTGQLDAAVDCAAIISACADVGLIAMIDEATDYLRLQDSM